LTTFADDISGTSEPDAAQHPAAGRGAAARGRAAATGAGGRAAAGAGRAAVPTEPGRVGQAAAAPGDGPAARLRRRAPPARHGRPRPRHALPAAGIH